MFRWSVFCVKLGGVSFFLLICNPSVSSLGNVSVGVSESGILEMIFSFLNVTDESVICFSEVMLSELELCF